MILKIVNAIIGFVIIFIGSLFMNITVFNETFKTITYKGIGCLIIVAGFYYLNKIGKFGK
jgi:hypothetical protein